MEPPNYCRTTCGTQETQHRYTLHIGTQGVAFRLIFGLKIESGIDLDNNWTAVYTGLPLYSSRDSLTLTFQQLQNFLETFGPAEVTVSMFTPRATEPVTSPQVNVFLLPKATSIKSDRSITCIKVCMPRATANCLLNFMQISYDVFWL